MFTRTLRGSGLFIAAALLVCGPTVSVFAAEGRQIEEVVVTAERRESTIQDTAISITAFTGEFIEDFGIRNQEDLQNYIPATTIQPYDLSIRGIGRLFRALGGDPGVATYFDGAYSEDFGIASTEGGLFDLERIEILRGPQGTLYGRNGVGGAVNFHSKKPSDEFEGEIKAIYGNYNTQEIFGMVSGPMIKDFLNARATGVKRTRDGFINDLTPGAKDINNYGDENYSLAFEITPSDNLSIYMRGNERSYRRRMSGAQGAGSIVISENGGFRDPITGGERWSSTPVGGWREVQGPGGATCATAFDRTISDCNVASGAVPYITNNNTNTGDPWYAFTLNGVTKYGQPLIGGVDTAGVSADGTTTTAFARPNYAYQAFVNGNRPEDIARLNDSVQGDGTELPELDGGDLDTFSNGLNDEFFDHQGAYMGITWDINDKVTLKYIGAYTDYFYDRTTEDDRTGFEHDQQFYAAQENENFQHEIQFFWDIGESITITSGLFYYENDIDQQLDFYSPDEWTRYVDPADYGAGGAEAFLTGDGTAFQFNNARGMVNHRTARNEGQAGNITNFAGLIGIPSFSDKHITDVYFADGPWMGDTFANTGRVDHGPVSQGTTFIWDTENRTKASAIYVQGEWQINDTWAITIGARWAEDKKEAEENLFLYQESFTAIANCVAKETAGDLGAGTCPQNLFEYNRDFTGGLDATGNVANFDRLRLSGIPYSRSIYRAIENDYDKTTWRLNFDYSPTDDDLFYFSTTSGYRAGGFNLGYFSFIPTYEPEELIAYELGYKGTLLDGTLQVNASAYYYDYEQIHLQFSTSSFTGVSTSVQNAPSARTIGAEIEVLWLTTDNLTLGFNYSYTNAEYNEELFEPLTGTSGVVDANNPYAPASLFTLSERNLPIDGQPLPRVPENKFTGWGEYAWQLGDNGKMSISTTVSYTDEFPAAGRPTTAGPLAIAPDFIRWDARASWISASEQWNVSAFVNNITDELGVRNQFTYGENQGHRRVIEPTNPRMFGLEVQYKFGAFQ